MHGEFVELLEILPYSLLRRFEWKLMRVHSLPQYYEVFDRIKDLRCSMRRFRTLSHDFLPLGFALGLVDTPYTHEGSSISRKLPTNFLICTSLELGPKQLTNWDKGNTEYGIRRQ